MVWWLASQRDGLWPVLSEATVKVTPQSLWAYESTRAWHSHPGRALTPPPSAGGTSRGCNRILAEKGSGLTLIWLFLGSSTCVSPHSARETHD